MLRIRVRNITISVLTGLALLTIVGYEKGVLNSYVVFPYELAVLPFLACAIYIIVLTFRQFKCPICGALMEKHPRSSLWYTRDCCPSCNKHYDILDYSTKELA